jgi:hypothetical protein
MSTFKLSALVRLSFGGAVGIGGIYREFESKGAAERGLRPPALGHHFAPSYRQRFRPSVDEHADSRNGERTLVGDNIRSIGAATLALGLAFVFGIASSDARAQQRPLDVHPRLPFTATLSNNTPLAFGMDVSETSRALRQQRRYLSGRSGEEIYLGFRDLGGSGLIPSQPTVPENSARDD